VTTSEPVRIGEGYHVSRQTNVLPELEGYEEISDVQFTYSLKPGWNIISNPYSGNVALADVKVQKGNSIPVTWTEAASNGWLTNAIFYNNGEDWGGIYNFETAPEAKIIPWIGYWIYLAMTDDVYYLVIPRP
jgi:hypothetical protein